MIRYIEIQAESNIQFLTTDDLPLQVNFIFENSIHENSNIKKNNINLTITKIDVNEPASEEISNNENSIVEIKCAYIAEHEGHLYFQVEKVKIDNYPIINSSYRDSAANNHELKIFHNDELIENSVWLKSGDFIRIEDKIIGFFVSGDRIDIKILDKVKTTVLTPPPMDELVLNRSKKNKHNHKIIPKSSEEFDKSTTSYTFRKKNSYKTNFLLILLLIALAMLASFIIFAESVTIIIEPEAEKSTLDGFFPAIKIGQNYLVLKGQYKLTAFKRGYMALDESINVSSNNNNFSFSMKEKPGLIQFNINPETNNKIFLDNILLDSVIDQDKKDLKNNKIQYEIDKGQYDLKIVNPRYKQIEQIIKVEGKNIVQEFDFLLEPNWGSVEISSSPDNALIEVYSKLSKKIPENNQILTSKVFFTPAEIELISGDYELIIKKEKYKSKKIALTVKSGEELKAERIELQPEDALLKVTSNPSNSIIRIDGQYYGQSPQSIKISPFVEHRVEVSLAGYKKESKSIILESEEVANLTMQLERKSGLIYITSSPKQARLYIDGKLQVKSSGQFTLNTNKHTITVKAKGYQSQTKTVNASSYSKNISFILEKKVSLKNYSKKGEKKYKPSTQSGSRVNKKNYINSIGQKMIFLPGDTFTMGSTKNEIGRRSNETQHKVKLSRSFYLSEKEISNKEFKLFKSTHNSGIISGQSLNLDKQPVVNVSWNEAAKFANWLSKKEGLSSFYREENGKMTAIDLKASNNGYRLPFETEWSYAARGKIHKKYPWQGKFPPKKVIGNFADDSAHSHVPVIIEGYNDQNIVSAPTGSYDKNESGFLDMGGNVSEWCQDYYAPYSGISGFSSSSNNAFELNPTGPEHGTHKVVRDSSWRDSSITELRLSYRNYSKKPANDIGFRIARYAK